MSIETFKTRIVKSNQGIEWMCGRTNKRKCGGMHGVIKWVLDRPNVGLRINPKVTFNDKGEVM